MRYDGSSENQLTLTDVVIDSDLDHAPNRVRHNDYSTSKAGAASIAFRAGSQKAKLLDAYRRAGLSGLTDEEAFRSAALPEHACYWKRCNELRDLGAIAPIGMQRPGLAGVPRMVCAISGSVE